jgi:hypothetical protein
MSLSCLLSLEDGIIFHRFRKNPFRPAKPGRPAFLVSVKPASIRPIQPALDAQHGGQGSRLSIGARSTPATLNRCPTAACPPRPLSKTERVEVLVVKWLAMVLALACIGCGFGIQHIAYIRQKNELCRQLRQKEVELRSVTQANRSLESCAFAKAAEDFRRVEACPVIAKHAPRKVPTRG